MKTKDLLLLLAGVGLGYLAFKRYKQNKPKTETQPLNVATTQAECEAKWNEMAKTMRFTQGTMETAKANFMLSCAPVLTATI